LFRPVKSVFNKAVDPRGFPWPGKPPQLVEFKVGSPDVLAIREHQYIVVAHHLGDSAGFPAAQRCAAVVNEVRASGWRADEEPPSG
jgi:hypothetical protein